MDEIWTQLSELAREVLWTLPVEPHGVSAQELSEELLARAAGADRERIEAALAVIAGAVGLRIVPGTDGLGHPDVPLYSLPREVMEGVRRAAAGQPGRSGP